MPTRKGDWITCPNGHRMARLTRDVCGADRISPTQFEDWQQQQSPPATDEPIAPCKICGEKFVFMTESEKAKERHDRETKEAAESEPG